MTKETIVETLLKKDKTKRVNQPTLKPAPMFSKEQQFMRTFFGHGDKVIFGNPQSQCKTNINGAIIHNRINGDEILIDNSSDMFGFGLQPHKTRSLFNARF